MKQTSVVYEGKIVFLDSYTLNPGDVDWAEMKGFPGLVCYDRTSADEIVERIGDAVVVITNKTRLGEEEFAQLPALKLVCVAATGFDVVDIEAASRHGVIVCNCAGYSTNAVAQMVVAHLLEVTNHVGHYTNETCREKKWSSSPDFCYWNAPLMELEGKKVAVVGYGNIGKAVIERLRPFGVRLFAVSSKSPSELPADVEKISMSDAFSQCDVVSLNCPLNSINRGFVNKELLMHVREGLVLINTARGGLIDEAAVATSLHEGRLGAYCCDVVSGEPVKIDNPLLSAPRVYMTPHIAWASPDARKRIIHLLASHITAFLAGKPESVVNP